MINSNQQPNFIIEPNLETEKIVFRSQISEKFIIPHGIIKNESYRLRVQDMLQFLGRQEIEKDLAKVNSQKELNELRLRLDNLSENMKLGARKPSLTTGYYGGERDDNGRYKGSVRTEIWAKDITKKSNVSDQEIVDLIRGNFAATIASSFLKMGKNVEYRNVKMPYDFSYDNPMKTFLVLTQAEELQAKKIPIPEKYNNILWQLRIKFPKNNKKEFDLALSRIGLKWDYEKKSFVEC